MLRILATSLLASAILAQSPPVGFNYRSIVNQSGLDRACTMAFAPDGRLFLCDRVNGNVRVVRGGDLEAQPWFTVTMGQTPTGESGLLGVAIDPGFLSNGYVYLYYTDTATGRNRIARLRDVAGQGTDFTVVTPPDAILTHPLWIHNGGRMLFGHDGKLYVAIGDCESQVLAQDPGSWVGKIVRLQPPDLAIPADNPIAGSPTYSLGHRNIFGLALHPGNSWLIASENGFLGGDEYNRIVAGGNYGWPFHEGPNPPNSQFIDPLQTLPVQPALTGLAFYAGNNYPGMTNDLISCHWIGGQLRRLQIDAAGSTIVSNALFDSGLNWCFDVAMGPDGNLWVLHGTGSQGGNRIGRYEHANAPNPGMHIMAVSGPALGGSITVGITAENGDLVLPWLGLSRLNPAVPSPIGPIEVQIDVQLPLQFVTEDDRSYIGIPLPRVPELVGLSLHGQALRIATSSFAMDLTNASTLVLR